MKKLTIEWKHFDKNGKTCQRCSRTGKNLNLAIKNLQKELSPKSIYLEFKEIKLPESRMAESNSILIDGVPLENLISDTKIGENVCQSCSDLIEKPNQCRCRTVKYKKQTFEEIPVNLIKQAIIERNKL